MYTNISPLLNQVNLPPDGIQDCSWLSFHSPPDIFLLFLCSPGTLNYIIPGIASVLNDGGSFVSLIKPQFEAGRQGIGKGGIVTSAAYRYLAVKRVINAAVENGFDCVGLIRSPIEGGDGNVEYLAHFVKKYCLKPKVDDKTILLITKRK